MKILGVSSNYHDSSASLVINGQVISAATEERFSLIKHDPSFPLLASRFCVEQAGLRFEDLDYVAYYEDPNVKFTRTMSSSFAKFPFNLKTFIRSSMEAITSGLRIKHTLSMNLDMDPDQIIYVPHHMSHAAHSFFGSPFKEAAVLSIDAVGEWACSGVFYGKDHDLEPLDAIFFPHSLGLIYSAFTAFLGFKANDGECSTMALAAFGEPKYAERVRDVIRVKDNGTYEIETSYFDFGNEDKVPVTEKFIRYFGTPRPFNSPLNFDCYSTDMKTVDEDQQRYADVAASIQLVLEEAVLGMVKYAKDKTGCENLCFSGGVALNAVANSKILSSNIFKDVYIPPDPGDGGGAMGAALYASMVKLRERNCERFVHPYYGKEYSEKSTLDMLKKINLERARHFSRDKRDFKFEIIEGLSDGQVIAHACDQIQSGGVVGWFQGRFENGPRALGNRSILADPANIESAKKLSRYVKHREAFRPYAISLTNDDADKILKTCAASRPAKWMQTSAEINRDIESKIYAAIHVDKTTRPQVCTEQDNPRYYQLMKEYGKRSGLSAILNTSFNENGMPLVASPNDALMMFMRTEMDTLVLNNSIVQRKV